MLVGIAKITVNTESHAEELGERRGSGWGSRRSFLQQGKGASTRGGRPRPAERCDGKFPHALRRIRWPAPSRVQP